MAGRGPITFSYAASLCREWHGPIPAQRRSELGEDRQIGVQPHALDSTHAEGQQRPFVLESSELALAGPSAAVERLGPGGVARDQRVQAIGLDPCGLRLALTGRAAPLGGLPFVVGPKSIGARISGCRGNRVRARRRLGGAVR